MNDDKWVMVRDNQEWLPRIYLRDLGATREGRYLCLTEHGTIVKPWREMRPATAIELLPMLPGEWAKRAMLRVKDYPYCPNEEVTTLAGAVYNAFIWDRTPERGEGLGTGT